ncbi:pre-mRNA-processing-splicing factor 8 [Ceratobasidium sp. AG-Ba]|nr:pre-mRNA-processing-splicing factor 8 [Ceratobasidium sp. AG-Ba]
MPDSPPRKVSTRERRPTQRLNDYDRAQGRLNALSTSVGRKVTPPTAESVAADRAKKQAAVAAARGNTSRPSALKPLQHSKHQQDDSNEDKLKDDPDDEAGPELLEYRLEDLENETYRIEWLNQSIEQLGICHDYRGDPNFREEQALHREWARLLADVLAPSHPPLTTGNNRIQTGLTHVLKPKTSGHSSRVQLCRTDHSTVGLDGLRIGSQDCDKHSTTPPIKLVRTNSSTFALDGKMASPHATFHSASRPTQPASKKRVRDSDVAPSRPNQPASVKRAHIDDSTSLKKKAVVSLTRIKALRKENAKTTGTSVRPSVKGTPNASKPNPPRVRSPPGTEMQDASGDEGAPQHMAGGHARSSSPVLELGGGPVPPANPPAAGNDATIEGSDREDQAAKQGGDKEFAQSKTLTKQQRTQLRSFPLEVRDLVQMVATRVKIDLSTICPYGDRVTERPQDRTPWVEKWMLKHWDTANVVLCEGREPFPLTLDYASYVRTQFPLTCNMMKKVCELLVPVYFRLRHSNPNSPARAKSLTDGGNERWISPNLINNKEIFQHPIISDTIKNAFFNNPKSFGYKHLESFTPLVPIPTVAFACSTIRNRIKAHEVDNGKAVDIDASTDSDAFAMYMTMLETLGNEKPALLLKVRSKITKQYLNARPQPSASAMPIPEMNLGSDDKDDEIDMESLEEIWDMLPEGAPEVADWDAVKEAQRKDNEWIKVEVALRDLILADFGKRDSVNIASLTSSEIQDIILGQEIAAPSIQRQQMVELEKSTEAQSQVTAIQTQTTNVHGDTLQVVTTTNYEQQVLSSKSDWRVRAISATHLPLRLQHVYVPTTTSRMTRDRTLAAFLYDASPPDNKQVKEIKAKIMADHPEWSSNSICLSCSLTSGSVSLSAHSFTVAGFEWDRKNTNAGVNPQGFNPNMSERVQLFIGLHSGRVCIAGIVIVI